MELKYRKLLIDLTLWVCSNRTFMELKFAALGSGKAGNLVLIVPLWN